ncbi:P-loop containing nucleoside triphosphate hydrolase protein [Coprinopsis sp. MPI-PUGE-AT-0042]|nr:P-loop containing nucleoside triphosphate hydrolase protein [Coprinopsis sp. MPI-PUGE-AT-0042]
MAVTADVAEEFIRSQFLVRGDPTKPLIVALQGPQGSGKSHLAAQLESALSNGSSPLRTIVLSIDDLYLPHQGLVHLSESYQHNTLLQGRGQPGTHDVALGLSVLSSLSSRSPEVCLPRFDKSKFNGEGDRLPAEESPVIQQPPLVDIIILEGWCVGFRAISVMEVEEKWKLWEEESAKLQIPDSLCGKADVLEINELLQQYDTLWDACHAFIQVPTKGN